MRWIGHCEGCTNITATLMSSALQIYYVHLMIIIHCYVCVCVCVQYIGVYVIILCTWKYR